MKKFLIVLVALVSVFAFSNINASAEELDHDHEHGCDHAEEYFSVESIMSLSATTNYTFAAEELIIIVIQHFYEKHGDYLVNMPSWTVGDAEYHSVECAYCEFKVSAPHAWEKDSNSYHSFYCRDCTSVFGYNFPIKTEGHTFKAVQGSGTIFDHQVKCECGYIDTAEHIITSSDFGTLCIPCGYTICGKHILSIPRYYNSFYHRSICGKCGYEQFAEHSYDYETRTCQPCRHSI